MKKIAFVVSDINNFGGVQKVTNIIANELAKETDLNISIISLFNSKNKNNLMFNKNIELDNIFYEKKDIKKNYIFIMKGIREYFKNNKIDILIVSGSGLVTLFFTALIGVDIKLIAWDHQAFNFGKVLGLEWFGKRIASKYCEKTVVITEDSLNQYTLNLKSKNINLIYNPLEWNYKKDNIYNEKSNKIISCGRLEHQKGFDILIDVANIVLKRNPNFEWHIWGEGSQREILQNKIDSLGLTNKLKLCGYSDNINEKYKDYSLYVMTSRHEGLPVVLIEAMSNKLPVVSFNCKTGPNEIIDDMKNGFLIDCFDIDKMASCIDKILNDKELRLNLSKNSSMILHKFNLGNIVEKWKKILE
ncbi:glycosyltransferase family 4 protein [Clostridium perfringens]|uniref:glycosyltransferase family 4 protein n=1 Tax=Clostridium perfringens TaxID=1502 RepID=UPI0018D7B8E3|nr:glycosyltransferase family 4 protein [Clostridium perfringens]QPS30459.1 glycosyltransferase family 4 protein [Clostridium perfringens]WFE18152.1 glycosyltransferase family 4 protein [Clostridium perfringens]STB42970.1 group 1 glycosyl transferase [Clostridium perfringens]